MMATWAWAPPLPAVLRRRGKASQTSINPRIIDPRRPSCRGWARSRSCPSRIVCYSDDAGGKPPSDASGIQLYNDIERIIVESARLSNDVWGKTGDWNEIEGAWVLKPRFSRPTSVVHFIGGIFVGAAPQITYRFFLERLSENYEGCLVIATPFPSGFDYFFIADEVQFKYDRCLRFLKDSNSMVT
ncbi:hypothetical protein ACLOJK_009467 [Asimina triloba]